MIPTVPSKTRMLTRLCEEIDKFYLTVKQRPTRLGFEKERLKDRVAAIVEEELDGRRASVRFPGPKQFRWLGVEWHEDDFENEVVSHLKALLEGIEVLSDRAKIELFKPYSRELKRPETADPWTVGHQLWRAYLSRRMSRSASRTYESLAAEVAERIYRDGIIVEAPKER